MNKTYDRHTHSYVRVEGLDLQTGDVVCDVSLFQIVLVSKDRVWIFASYAERRENFLVVGDGIGDGFDEDGNCILSVPAALCAFFTADEADLAHEIAEAEAEIFAQAIG